MYLVSLIIPIYNAEDYLDNTINSVINQSIGFENIELILVDDNSQDKSREIIKKYTKQYENIVPYYSKENHGYPGFGRNIGLKKSTADYIMFMDNDDEIDIDMCKKLYETIKNENADVVCSNYLMIDDIGEKKGEVKYINGIENENKTIIKNEDIILFRNIAVWNKIYKKEIILKNNINFEEKTYADDFIFIIKYFLKSKKLIFLKNFYGYVWNIRSNSLSHAVKIEHVEKLINSSKYILEILKKEKMEHLSVELFKDNIPYWLFQCSSMNESKNEHERILKEIRNFENEINLKKLDVKWADIINYFILNENYTIAILLIKTMGKLRQLNILRKIKRKIKC